MKLQLCVFLVLGLAFSVQTEKIQTVLAEVKDHPFGAAVGALIQMQLTQDTGRLNDINDFLENLLSKLDTEDDRADAEWEKTKARCDTKIPASQKQLKELQDKLADLEEEKKQLQEEKQNKTTDLREEEGNLGEAKNSLADGERQLDVENKTFEQRKADFNEAIIACQEALRILRKMVHDPSVLQMVQLNSDFNSLRQTFERSHEKLGGQHSAYIQPIIDVLMQLANESQSNNHLNLERLKEVIKLIQMLLDRLKGQFTLAETTHKTNVENIQKLITDYRKAIVSSNRKIEVLLARLQDINERLGAINIDQVKSLIATTQETLNLIQQECDDDKAAYEKAKKQRENERAILEELIKHFKDKVVGSTENIQDAAYQDNLNKP